VTGPDLPAPRDDLPRLADRLQAAAAALAELRPRVERGEPWPFADVYGAEPEASWGPRELLAHVDEMLPFWLGEIERILEGDPVAGAVPFGRVADDTLRVGVIGRDRTVPLRELFARLASDSARVAARLRELAPRDADRLGSHPRRGPMSVGELADDFIVGHLEGHTVQLREILDAAGA
jgi:hypothetical protein